MSSPDATPSHTTHEFETRHELPVKSVKLEPNQDVKPNLADIKTEMQGSRNLFSTYSDRPADAPVRTRRRNLKRNMKQEEDLCNQQAHIESGEQGQNAHQSLPNKYTDGESLNNQLHPVSHPQAAALSDQVLTSCTQTGSRIVFSNKTNTIMSGTPTAANTTESDYTSPPEVVVRKHEVISPQDNVIGSVTVIPTCDKVYHRENRNISYNTDTAVLKNEQISDESKCLYSETGGPVSEDNLVDVDPVQDDECNYTSKKPSVTTDSKASETHKKINTKRRKSTEPVKRRSPKKKKAKSPGTDIRDESGRATDKGDSDKSHTKSKHQSIDVVQGPTNILEQSLMDENENMVAGKGQPNKATGPALSTFERDATSDEFVQGKRKHMLSEKPVNIENTIEKNLTSEEHVGGAVKSKKHKAKRKSSDMLEGDAPRVKQCRLQEETAASSDSDSVPLAQLARRHALTKLMGTEGEPAVMISQKLVQIKNYIGGSQAECEMIHATPDLKSVQIKNYLADNAPISATPEHMVVPQKSNFNTEEILKILPILKRKQMEKSKLAQDPQHSNSESDSHQPQQQDKSKTPKFRVNDQPEVGTMFATKFPTGILTFDDTKTVRYLKVDHIRYIYKEDIFEHLLTPVARTSMYGKNNFHTLLKNLNIKRLDLSKSHPKDFTCLPKYLQKVARFLVAEKDVKRLYGKFLAYQEKRRHMFMPSKCVKTPKAAEEEESDGTKPSLDMGIPTGNTLLQIFYNYNRRGERWKQAVTGNGRSNR